MVLQFRPFRAGRFNSGIHRIGPLRLPVLYFRHAGQDRLVLGACGQAVVHSAAVESGVVAGRGGEVSALGQWECWEAIQPAYCQLSSLISACGGPSHVEGKGRHR